MPDTPEFLYGRLLDEGEKTSDFFKGLSAESWECMIYTDGSQWTVQQVLAHFVSTESAINKLVENILGGGAGAPEDFDIDSYNERKVAALNEVPRGDLLGQFSSLRKKNAELIMRLSSEDLERIGRHPFLGMTSLNDIVKLLYRHNQIHLRDMRRALS